MSVKNRKIACYFSTANRSTFFFDGGSTAWLYDRSHFQSPLYEADECFDSILTNYQNNV